MNDTITIVSGLPRSGTSLMMKMLVNAGLSPVLDNLRKADTDNLGGYFEYEKVRRMTDMTVVGKEWLSKQRKDFILFIDEYDKRREKNFLKTFPEMKDFYNLCKSL